ncbi:MAG TPA: exosortase/archaeosortase family protein [Tepidisphaeraceae bacterium]|nr:exosortase/archaeosortase family protein [Tepidisphaeraceae bacterium]
MTQTVSTPVASPAVGASRPTMRRIVNSLTSDRLGVWHVVAAALMGLLGVLAMLPAWQDMYHATITDEENSQAVLAPVVCLVLIWVRRMRLRHCKPSFRLIGPIIAAAGWGVSCFGFYHDYHALWHFGAILVMVGCVLSVLGKNVLFRFFPAFAVLVFMVTVPIRLRMAIAFPLEHWTALVTQQALQLCGVINTRVDGNLLRVNNTPVNIAEACNGISAFFGLVLVCYAFGFCMPLRNSVRILILLASPLTAIGCNVARILVTMLLLAHFPHQWADMGHTIGGWAMLPVAFLLLYGIIVVLRWAMIPVTVYTLPAQSSV